MSELELHPEILRKDGKEQFVILPWDDFVQLQELLENAYDVLEIRRAREADSGEPGVPLKEMMRRFNGSPGDEAEE